MSDVNWIFEVFKIATTLLAAGLGAWLSVRFLPVKAKQDEWLWQKKLEAQEYLFNNLSEVFFVSKHYLNGEFGERYSMSGKSLSATEEYVQSGVADLHKRAASLQMLLTSQQSEILNEYLSATQQVMDKARDTWGEWDQDDEYAVESHTNTTISDLHRESKLSLKKLKGTIEPLYK